MRIMSFISKYRAFTLFCACAIAIVLLSSVFLSDNNRIFTSYDVESIEIRDFVMISSNGESQSVTLPATIPFGIDGEYTLVSEIPEYDASKDMSVRLYSNYVDISAYIDGEPALEYSLDENARFGGTGNTYHSFGLGADSAHKTLTIKIRCQLGDSITYYLKPALVNTDSAFLYADIRSSFVPIMFAACLFALSVCVLLAQRLLKPLVRNESDLTSFGLFIIIFAVYVCSETELVLALTKSGRLVYMTAFFSLLLLPIPIFKVYIRQIKPNLRKFGKWVEYMCALNFVAQTALHFSGLRDFRAMMPYTHACMIIGMLVVITLSLMSGKRAVGRTLCALPLAFGGILDILLLSVNRPSFHNNFYFVLGVAVFMFTQIYLFARGYIRMYHASVQSEVLRSMAFSDTLTGLKNRNAYENRLMELGANPPEKLYAIVADINGLKQINDRFGHSEGDAALVQMGEALTKLVPEGGECFRTGGDEFVVLIENIDDDSFDRLGRDIYAEVMRRGSLLSLPIVPAIGQGKYSATDGTIPDFIRRVDTLMYLNKMTFKNGGSKA